MRLVDQQPRNARSKGAQELIHLGQLLWAAKQNCHNVHGVLQLSEFLWRLGRPDTNERVRAREERLLDFRNSCLSERFQRLAHHPRSRRPVVACEHRRQHHNQRLPCTCRKSAHDVLSRPQRLGHLVLAGSRRPVGTQVLPDHFVDGLT